MTAGRARHSAVLLRIPLSLLFFAAAGCRDTTIAPSSSELVASAERVDFGVVAIGEAFARGVTVTNSGTTKRSLTVAVGAPFSSELTERVLTGGESVVIRLSFAPTDVGLAEEQLRIETDGPPLTVGLSGAGVRAEDVCPVAACERAEVSNDGVCLRSTVADETACTTSCVEGGACRAGRCIGNTINCDDGDACTTDGCGENGCLHVQLECESQDPCRAAACDPSLGCITVAVSDGTRCGRSSCGGTRVCISDGGVRFIRMLPVQLGRPDYERLLVTGGAVVSYHMFDRNSLSAFSASDGRRLWITTTDALANTPDGGRTLHVGLSPGLDSVLVTADMRGTVARLVLGAVRAQPSLVAHVRRFGLS